MMFTVPAAELAAAVQYAARWLDAKPANPVYGGLLFDIPAWGDRLSIFGMGDSAAGRASLAVESDDTGMFLASGRLLAQLVATFPDKPVTFETDGDSIHIRAGRWTGTIPAMPEKDYPSLPGVAPEIGRIDGAALADAVRRVGAAAHSDSEKQPILCGIHLGFGQASVTFTATDRYRAGRMDVDWKLTDHGAAGGESLPYAHALIDGVAAFAGSPDVAIGLGRWLLSLSTADRALTVRSQEAERYPARGPNPVFDTARPASFTLNVKDLIGPDGPLSRAALMRWGDAKTHVIRIGLSEGLLTLAASGEGVGGGDEEIDVGYDGEPTSMLLRLASLQTALRAAPGDVLNVGFFPGQPKAMLLTSPADPAWRFSLQPLGRMG